MIALSHAFVDELLQDVILFVTFLGALWAIFKFPAKKWQTWLHRHRDARDKLDETLSEIIPNLLKSHEDTHKSLAFIMSELKPNHGTSLKDAVNRIEKMMYRSEAIQKGIMSQDNTPLFLTDDQGFLIWCNAAYLDLVNRDTTELMGRGYLNVVEKSQQEDIRNQASAAVMDKRDIILYFNVDTEEPNSPLIPVEVNATPMINAKGYLEGYIGSLKRLDNHYDEQVKGVENSLRRIEEQVLANRSDIAKLDGYHMSRDKDIESIESTLQSIEDQIGKTDAMIRTWWAQEDKPLYLTDSKGNCIWVNNAMTDFTKVDSTELLGKGWMNIMDSSQIERVSRESEVGIRDKREIMHRYTMISDEKAGPVEVLATSVPVLDHNGNLVGYMGNLKVVEAHRRKDD